MSTTDTPSPVADGYRLLVFDWDGTLMDSIGTIVACMEATVAELGLPTVTQSAIRATIGLGLREAVDDLYPEGGDELYHRVVTAYRRRWLGGFAAGQNLFPGARQALERLADQGYWLAVATGKGRMGLDYDLERTGMAPMFLATRTVSESPAKPSPAMVHEILDELGVRADEALVVGDTTHDLDMATAAGAVGVICGSSTEEQLATRQPLAILPRVADLPDWLQAS